MRHHDDRSITFYRFLVRGYPRRFRGMYEEAIVDAFALELERVDARRGALVAFWAFMLFDLVASIAMTRTCDAWRRLVHNARLMRGSTGMTAALATLVVMAVWAWSRFATHSGGGASDATLTFWVSALHAGVTWGAARLAELFSAVASAGSHRVQYRRVRRSRLVGGVAKVSAMVSVVAAISTMQRSSIHAGLVSPSTSVGYWVFLAVTLGAMVGVYFVVDRWLRVRHVV